MQVRIFNNERMTNQKKSYGITLPIHETTFHTCIQTFEQSLYIVYFGITLVFVLVQFTDSLYLVFLQSEAGRLSASLVS